MKISHSDSKAIYMGRYDRSPEETKLYFAGSQIKLKFRGTSLSMTFSASVSWGKVSIGAVIDGQITAVPLYPENNGRDISAVIAESLENKGFHLRFYRFIA